MDLPWSIKHACIPGGHQWCVHRGLDTASDDTDRASCEMCVYMNIQNIHIVLSVSTLSRILSGKETRTTRVEKTLVMTSTQRQKNKTLFSGFWNTFLEKIIYHHKSCDTFLLKSLIYFHTNGPMLSWFYLRSEEIGVCFVCPIYSTFIS